MTQLKDILVHTRYTKKMMENKWLLFSKFVSGKLRQADLDKVKEKYIHTVLNNLFKKRHLLCPYPSAVTVMRKYLLGEISETDYYLHNPFPDASLWDYFI